MTGQTHAGARRDYLPAMGRHWLLPLYDPFTRLAGVGRIYRQLLDRAHLTDGADSRRILEIGCGTGNLLTTLGRRRPELATVGIDPDPAALRKARRKAARRGLQIRYEQAFADELPVADASFDRVLSSFMLHHLEEDERLRTLREVRRVLRPGGELHVVDVDGTPSGHNRRHQHPRVAGSRPELVLAALREAGLAEVAENGRHQARFGGYVFYRATRPDGEPA
ncbi:class I SAM-dependent methyltransferase [Actinoplanes sp. NPDC049599]|uniref:class I SAM-dependent methyltransferase n=1 Tax=Actinoplanes sp. NPDC049599 TaxID=3363903 RepID=UPI0037B049FC